MCILEVEPGPCTIVSFLYVYLVFYFIYGRAGCSLLCRLFSSCGTWELFFRCSARASHCSGFSCCGAQAPELWCQLGLRCPVACGIFRDQGSNRCLLHWQAVSLPLSHQGSPALLFFVFLPNKNILFIILILLENHWHRKHNILG